tara:strand:- start:4727 stop:5080 length:354 start_codon:yes stop_codon:yes gene_type:complete
MRTKARILTLLLTLLVISTSAVLAYGNSSKKEITEKNSCSKEDTHSEKKSCCEKDDNDCSGACDNTFCHCPSAVNIPVFTNDLQLSNTKNCMFSVNDWAYVQHIPNAVYLSIWQPPK